MTSYHNLFKARLFSERNRIIFEYPPTSDGTDMIVFLPFYENAKITESQTANFAEYNPVGRAGSLYAYTGASSRKIKVKMIFTLPHLAMHDMGIDKFMRVFKGQGDEAAKLLFTSKSKYSSKAKPGDANKSLSVAVEKMYNFLVEEELATNYIPAEALEAIQNMGFTERHKVLDTLLFFIAMLRTSVTNNATNPLQGPPLLRLVYGTLYQSVPCVCKSYNINWDEHAGYDVTTTTPRRIEVSLNLEEVRVGDFSQYDPATMLKRDNLTGWESAINSPHTTDPLPAAGFWAGGN